MIQVPAKRPTKDLKPGEICRMFGTCETYAKWYPSRPSAGYFHEVSVAERKRIKAAPYGPHVEERERTISIPAIPQTEYRETHYVKTRAGYALPMFKTGKFPEWYKPLLPPQAKPEKKKHQKRCTSKKKKGCGRKKGPKKHEKAKTEPSPLPSSTLTAESKIETTTLPTVEVPSESPEIEVEPSESPEIEVEPSESPEIEVEPSESPEIEVEPSESPEIEVEPSESPEIEVEPSESPEIEVEPSESPEIEVEPSESPEIEVEPSESPEIVVEPSESPEIVVEPSESPEIVVEPSESPEIVVEPSESPEIVVEPSESPEIVVEPSESPEIVVETSESPATKPVVPSPREQKREKLHAVAEKQRRSEVPRVILEPHERTVSLPIISEPSQISPERESDEHELDHDNYDGPDGDLDKGKAETGLHNTPVIGDLETQHLHDFLILRSGSADQAELIPLQMKRQSRTSRQNSDFIRFGRFSRTGEKMGAMQAATAMRFDGRSEVEAEEEISVAV